MGYYIILRGPPGVGKTSVADNLRSTLKGKTVHINIDELRKMPYRANGSHEEKMLANQNAIDLCRNFLDAKYRVIIEELFYERELLDQIDQNLPSSLYFHKTFFLTASLETCLERNRERRYSLKEEQVRRLYERVSSITILEEVIISTENKSIEQIVGEILPRLPKR